MIRWTAILAVLSLAAACAAPPEPGPEKPACRTGTEKDPIDGGLGGTGNAPEEACPPES
ncbi:MAG: hypothetical protein AAF666_06065 [Pseudomonadota bacterium]